MTNNRLPQVFLDVSVDGDPAERMIFELFHDVVPKTAENFRALCTGEHGKGPVSGKPLHYKGCPFTRIAKGLMAQLLVYAVGYRADGHDCFSCDVDFKAGDVTSRDGSGGESIYGGNFEVTEKGRDRFEGGRHPAGQLARLLEATGFFSIFIFLLTSGCFDILPDESFTLKHDGRGYLSMSNTGPNSNNSQFFITFRAAHHLDGLHVVFGKLVQGHRTLKKIESAGSKQGEPTFFVKIVNCGELLEGAVRRKGKSKKPSRGRRKRRRYSSSESDSSSDSSSESSESDSDSDSYSSSSSDISSSSEDRRRKRRRSYKRDKYKRGKRRRERRREKKRRRRDKRSRRKSKRSLESSSDTESENTSASSSEDDQVGGHGPSKPKHSSHTLAGKQSPIVVEKDAIAPLPKGVTADMVGKSPQENGNLQSNGVKMDRSNSSADRQPDLVDLPGKSRSRSMSPKKAMSKSMSISPRRSLSKSPSVRRERSMSKSLTPRSAVRSPERVPQQSRSISESPGRKSVSSRSRSQSQSQSRSWSRSRSRSLARSISRSPSPVSPRNKPRRSISMSPDMPLRSRSQTPVRSISRRSRSRSLLRSSHGRTISRTPVKACRSVSRSPVRASRRSISRSPIRRASRRSLSRSPVVARSRRSVSRSPIRPPSRSRRRGYSRSPVSPLRRGRSPIPSRGRSPSRSVSPDGSPKRVRRGRGFSQRYAYARRYRTPSADRSPLKLRRYSGRSDRDRYSSYRSYNDRSRYNRSPLRGRTPPRYRSRRSWSRSRSVSRSPNRHRSRGKGTYSRSPMRSHSPLEKSRSRGSLRAEKRSSLTRSKSRSQSQSRSRSPSDSRSSADSPSPQHTSKDNSRSVSGSPAAKGLVSYGDGSPDSSDK
ncbi:hypothetical protein IFM89_003081 [Coptis chinensis]|uniref:PPIase cyclophilin-type domain-containing protein n=1 Tax=Coptis chinensis TaxID=261450 RepID=A0A835M3H0_9MAGN|nr:hypothetical protein IFM89_003081 [Coptis chinensis]